MFERELFSICDGLPRVSRIGQLLRYGVDLDISDEVHVHVSRNLSVEKTLCFGGITVMYTP